jgi:hypothetical protein
VTSRNIMIRIKPCYPLLLGNLIYGHHFSRGPLSIGQCLICFSRGLGLKFSKSKSITGEKVVDWGSVKPTALNPTTRNHQA